jgi:hypothetical protein
MARHVISLHSELVGGSAAHVLRSAHRRYGGHPSHPTVRGKQTGYVINFKVVTRAIDFDRVDRRQKNDVSLGRLVVTRG